VRRFNGEILATNIKEVLKQNQLLDVPFMLSVLICSVMNYFATTVLKLNLKKIRLFIYEELSKSGAHEVRNKVEEVALKQGMISIPDNSELILTFKF
jgi:hypothetical protein